ncbi:MAG: hypothetical protein LBC35_01035 [Coriobacteriales bacterium]|jgi:hypothetical protein|nr:hypothetical protein [Coriobacteriales bacterium]
MKKEVSFGKSKDLNSLDAGKSFFIGPIASFEEYCENETFRLVLENGNFTSLPSGCFVVNDAKYVTHDQTGIKLTDYAKTHLKECSLHFDRDFDGSITDNAKEASFDSADRKKSFRRQTSFNPNSHNMAVFNRSCKLREFYDELMEDAHFHAITELNFAQLAAAHIKRKGYNRKVFVEKTQLSIKTYERIMNNEIPAPALETVIAICIGLQLSFEHSLRLLEAAGYRLTSSPLHMAYRKLLSTHIGHSIKACNEILVALGLPPLNMRSS